eukprot:IDg9687t1
MAPVRAAVWRWRLVVETRLALFVVAACALSLGAICCAYRARLGTDSRIGFGALSEDGARSERLPYSLSLSNVWGLVQLRGDEFDGGVKLGDLLRKRNNGGVKLNVFRNTVRFYSPLQCSMHIAGELAVDPDRADAVGAYRDTYGRDACLIHAQTFAPRMRAHVLLTGAYDAASSVLIGRNVSPCSESYRAQPLLLPVL